MADPTEILRLRENCIHQNPWWAVYFDEVRHPNGSHGNHLRLRATSEKPGAVVLVVRRSSDSIEIGVVRSYRYAQRRMMWEAPRGFAEKADVDGYATAVRELEEETGLVAEQIMELGYLTSDSSIIEGEVVAFLVVVADGADGACDEDETNELRWIVWEDFLTMARSGDIRDGFTLGALGLLAAHGGISDAVRETTR